MKRLLYAAAVAALLIGPVVAAPEWIKLTSANFELYTAAGERDARETLVLFEQVRDFFMRVKSKTVTTRLPVTIVGFRNAKDYKPYQPGEAVAAYYNGDEQRDYIVMGSLGTENAPAAIHEYMHLIVRHSGLKLPVWLNEGFAEVYSTLKPMGGQIILGAVPPGRAIALGQAKWLPLAKLISVTHDSPEYNEKDRIGTFYAESWMLAHMLMLHDYYRDGFPKFIAAIHETSDSEKAFDSVYHKKLWEIESDLNSYFRARSINEVRYKTRFEKIQIDPAKPAGALELGITLAKLKTFLGNYDDATKRFTELAKNNPDSVEIEEALAHLYWREDKREEAVKHMACAATLGGTSWKTYWDYARLLGSAGGDAYIDALHKTLERKPDLQEARFALGSQLVRQRNWEQALGHLRQVSQVEPENASGLFLMMAFCAVNLDQPEEARTYATNARKYAKEPKSIQDVDRMIAFLDRQAVADRSKLAPQSPAAHAIASPLPETAPAEPTLVSVKGNFKRLDCVGDVWRVHVMDGYDTFVLLMRQQPAGQKLKCGPQNAGIAVEYKPGKDPKFGTVGEVTHLEFIE